MLPITELLTTTVDELTLDQLDHLVRHLNDQYRSGEPLVSDESFDQIYLSALQERHPEHEFFLAPQPESLTSKGRVAHGERKMLSTQKAYSAEEIAAWVSRCKAAATEIGIDPDSLQYRLTPKLDGIAGRYEPAPAKLVSRGDGEFGYDLSHLFDAGLVIKGHAAEHCAGEIILDEAYFQSNLREISPHPRNFVAGIASADTLSQPAIDALNAGAVHFVVYNDVDAETVDADTLLRTLDVLLERINTRSSYRLDGVVIEITHAQVRRHMGATNHHHCWQIAKKSQGDTAVVKVLDVIWQPSRTGRINPVISIEPTFLDGCSIQRVTAHNARHVVNHGIGAGAKIEIVRSGSVIPTFMKTHDRVVADIPEACPCCDHPLEWEGDFLLCYGPSCTAQAITHIESHFKKIQADLFGPKTVEKLVAAGYDCIEKIYPLSAQEYQEAGFGPGQARNLAEEIARVKTEPLRDFLLLGSLGIKGLGRGNSRKLLAHHSIDTVLQLTRDDLAVIDGFGDITSASIVADLADIASTYHFLMSQGFNLTHSKASGDSLVQGPLSGLKLVFTGKMSGNRDAMQEQARQAGATTQSAVSASTSLLVCGEGVGQSKLGKAQKLGVEIISETDYFARYFPGGNDS